MNETNYFLWEPDIYLIEINNFKLRWYALFFVIAFLLGRLLIVYFHKKEGKSSPSTIFQLFFAVIGTLFGARMGHVLFYQPDLLQVDFFELFKFWKQGLSSHGTAFGMLLSLFLFCHRIEFKGLKIKFKDRFLPNNSYLQIMDRLVIGIAMGAVLIRIGNFINSEMIGIPTNSGYGVVFLNPFTEEVKQTLPFVKDVSYEILGEDFALGKPFLQVSIFFDNKNYLEERIKAGVDRLFFQIFGRSPGTYQNIFNPQGNKLKYRYERTPNAFSLTFKAVGIARHPTQLYESLTLFLTFLFLFSLWKCKGNSLVPGHILGWFLIILFSFRLIHEILKENQTGFAADWQLNTGQILSLPYIVLGLVLLGIKRQTLKSI